jgi:hypothetical protein
MKSKYLVTSLAFAALFFAVIHPPEAYPDGKLVVILCATFALFSGLVERRIPRTYIYGGLTAFSVLIVHSFLLSVDTYRSLEFATILWAYYCLFGFFFYAAFEPEKPLAICMVVLCAIVSGYGLYQYFWGFEELHSYVTSAGSDQVTRIPALERIASRRVFSTLALPGTLWGFLTIALPFHAFLWHETRRARPLIAAGVAMLLATGLLTRSFGFLVGLFLLAASWLFIYHRRVMWRLAPVVLILALVGGVFYSIREGGIATANPVSLRAMNWVTGWTIFAAYPMGTGLNTYGIMYSQYRLPGSNETQYAHNTLLQLLSELGYIALIAGAGVLLLVMGAWHRGELRRLSPYLLLAFAVWTVHNLIDINVYFPSLGVVGAVLLATLLKRQAATPQAVPKGAIGVLVSLGAVTLIFSSLVMVSSELQVRAQGEFDENKLQEAARTLETATALMPFNSSLFHDFGDINLNLYHKHKDYKRLDLATRSFQRAIALSPNKAGSHLGLSLCFSSANRIEDARAQLRVAERLYPDSTYVQAVARLLDKRKAGITN